MKKAELNKIYTTKVNNYLAKGYTIHLASMSGSQGEIAHIDLSKGEELIRILIEEKLETFDPGSIRILVGKSNILPHDNFGKMGNTIWNNELETIEEEVFYKSSFYNNNDWLISEEEAKANKAIREARYKAKADKISYTDCTDKATIKALLPYINKLEGCKSIKARHITEVEKQINSDGSFVYRIIIQKKDKEKIELLSSKTLKKMRGAC